MERTASVTGNFDRTKKERHVGHAELWEGRSKEECALIVQMPFGPIELIKRLKYGAGPNMLSCKVKIHERWLSATAHAETSQGVQTIRGYSFPNLLKF